MSAMPENEASLYIDFDDRPAIRRLRKDLMHRAGLMGRQEARYLVKVYYQFQRDRIRANNRIKAIEKNNAEPVNVLGFFMQHFQNLEKMMVAPLEGYVQESEVGRWLMSQKGIGPVLAAGLLAHLDVEKGAAATSFWRYAGLDPTLVWEKGKIRPYNADLKVLCFKVGKSFVMTGHPVYRPLLDERKAYEAVKNEAGEYAEQAAKLLARLKVKPVEAKVSDHEMHDRDMDPDSRLDIPGLDEEGNPLNEEVQIDEKEYRKTLLSGKLVKAHLDARARRWIVKLFLSHLHTVMYEAHYKTRAPLPYAIAHLNHVHQIPVPDYVSPYI